MIYRTVNKAKSIVRHRVALVTNLFRVSELRSVVGGCGRVFAGEGRLISVPYTDWRQEETDKTSGSDNSSLSGAQGYTNSPCVTEAFDNESLCGRSGLPSLCGRYGDEKRAVL